MRVGERGEEGARTGRGNGDGVEVARWIACRPSEPIKVHNLERIRTAMVWHDRVVDNIALWVHIIVRNYKILPIIPTDRWGK